MHMGLEQGTRGWAQVRIPASALLSVVRLEPARLMLAPSSWSCKAALARTGPVSTGSTRDEKASFSWKANARLRACVLKDSAACKQGESQYTCADEANWATCKCKSLCVAA